MKTAVYTTLYPDALRFWDDFMRSIAHQTDKHFTLFVCLDNVEAPESHSALHDIVYYKPRAKTIAGIRWETWRHIWGLGYDSIVMVDADDFLMPERVFNAKKSIYHNDVDVCGLTLVDENLHPMDYSLLPEKDENTLSYILYENDIGLSNTAFRTDFLKAIESVPDNVKMLDWFLAIKAVEMGVNINKREDEDMLYRQYNGNYAHFLPPYTLESVREQTMRVIDFWHGVLPYLSELRDGAKARLDDVENSLTMIDEKYINNLNHSKERPRWWHMVAKR